MLTSFHVLFSWLPFLFEVVPEIKLNCLFGHGCRQGTLVCWGKSVTRSAFTAQVSPSSGVSAFKTDR